MSLLKNRWLWLSLLGVLVTSGLLVVVVGYVAVVVSTALVTGAPIVGALLDVAVPLLLAVAVLVVGLSVSAVAALWVFVQNTSLPRSRRVGNLVEWAEREYPPLQRLGLASFLSPPELSADETAERALADLKRQYVEGDISETEFERKVDRLVTNESLDETRADRERRRVVERQ